jgi:hypothetical protein
MNKIKFLFLILTTLMSCNKYKKNETIESIKIVTKENKKKIKSIGSPCNIEIDFITNDSIKVKIEDKIMSGKFVKSKTADKEYNIYQFYVKDSLFFEMNYDYEDLYIINNDYHIGCDGNKLINLE